MFGLFVPALLGTALGHTIVQKPAPREREVHHAIDQGCGNSRHIGQTFQRGQDVDLEWAANNHHGGFTQVSIMPLKYDPNRDAKDFDNPANIVYVTCYNKDSCQLAGGGDEFGLGEDGTDTWGNVCRDRFTMPAYFQDGEYVMKVSIFGNGVNWGIRNMPHPTYGNCHNFRLSGGASLTDKPTGQTHIKWNLQDVAIQRMNAEKGWSIPQNQCLFLGANQRNGCEGGRIDGGWYGDCKGNVADVSRCGQGEADTFEECESGGNWDWVGGTKWVPGGAKIYNWMVGLPVHHPQYEGKFTMLSHVRDPRTVKIQVQTIDADAGWTDDVGSEKDAGSEREIDLNFLSAADRKAMPMLPMGAAAAFVVATTMAIARR